MEENKEEISEGFGLIPHNSEGWFLVMRNAIQFFIFFKVVNFVRIFQLGV